MARRRPTSRRRLLREGLRRMATKAANTAEATETREEAAEGPLIDATAATIKKMVARGKERGYVTYDELNAALPPDQVSSEQIEDTMTMLSEAGINVFAQPSDMAGEGDGATNGATPPAAAATHGATNGAAAETEPGADGEVIPELAGEEAEGEESSISLAAMELALKPQVLETFD